MKNPDPSTSPEPGGYDFTWLLALLLVLIVQECIRLWLNFVQQHPLFFTLLGSYLGIGSLILGIYAWRKATKYPKNRRD